MTIGRILEQEALKRKEIIALLQNDNAEEFGLLLARADQIRKHYLGNEIYLRGIIEFSNYCEQNCLYCGLRARNRTLQRYRMDEKLILKSAELINASGIKTIVLQ